MTDSEIQSKVNECLAIFNPNHSIPFPAKNLHEKDDNLLVQITPYSDNDVSGFITYDKNKEKFKIFVNANKPRRRVNFTLAHELGHYFLHRDILKETDFLEDNETLNLVTLYRKDDGRGVMNPVCEREANRFAAKLLMPEEYVRRAWLVFKNVEMCALVFDVSVIAMSIRFNELGIETDEE